MLQPAPRRHWWGTPVTVALILVDCAIVGTWFTA